MSPAWEKFFFVLTFITQGSSYLSARAYGIMHRMHHAYTDTELDPHSPAYDKNAMAMMMRTANIYHGILYGTIPVEERFTKNVPDWRKFDLFASSWPARIFWVGVYILFYAYFAPSLWWFLLIPIHAIMGPLHGVIINWFAHKYGHENYEMDNTSKNLFKLDWLMFGEGYHNNHHKFPSQPNFASRRGEFDLCYPIIKLLHKTGVIKVQGARTAVAEKAKAA